MYGAEHLSDRVALVFDGVERTYIELHERVARVAGALAALFGGSNLQVSGPTGTMTVVLVPIVAQHGPGGVLMVGLLAGLVAAAAATH